jgi:hypothetical protein
MWDAAIGRCRRPAESVAASDGVPVTETPWAQMAEAVPPARRLEPKSLTEGRSRRRGNLRGRPWATASTPSPSPL